MTREKSRKRLPPYVSYRTFRSFIDGLQQRIPARIDRSYWNEMLSGSTGTQLMAALRFLGLIDNDAKPTNRLRSLAAAKNEQRAEILRETTSDAYSFALQGSLDLQNATYAQLNEAFHDTFRLAHDVNRKCIKFFVSLAADAGIPLSPFMTKRFRVASAVVGNATTKNITKRTRRKINENTVIPSKLEQVPEDMLWNRMLLDKFPSYDPNWGDEIQLKWFIAYDELLKRYSDKSQNGHTP
ncbi:MAG: DUF5343 domain-containing protein [Chloroflexi bacterium]|nr:DUF5343 domain-containing protein [Chloroflexota bacterium]